MPAILFSALTNVPVSQTFAAGVIPGLILLAFMVIVVLIKCRNIRNPEPASAAERWRSFLGALPGLFTPIIILGGIYAGLLTPSESAAVAGVWAIVMGFFIYRELTFASLCRALKETATITAIIFAIIATATFLSVVLTYSQIPQQIVSYFTDMGATFALFWVALAIICLLLGTFVEIVPVFYLTVPIFAAITLSFNQSLLHLYVVFRRLCRDRHDHPTGLCRHLHERQRHSGKPGQGIPRGATFCWRWYSLWDFDDPNSRSLHLAPVFANQIMIR
jgi:C4-dicarboxylate transporter DctM subunit